LKNGSPNWLIDRTFSVTVCFPKESQKVEKPRRNYRNPIYLAKEYKKMIVSGEVKSEADLARKLGISRVRVNQIISVLKLAPQIIIQIEKLGDPLLSRIVTERMLRSYVGVSLKEQEVILQIIKS
jgi:biotin operon repressor